MAILRRLVPILRDPEGFAPGEQEFNELALAIFRYQRGRCEPYRMFCESAGAPTEIEDWRQIPCVPTDAFKFYRMACFAHLPGEISYRTSGTTSSRSGIHILPTPNLYNAAAMTWFSRHMLPENEVREQTTRRAYMQPFRLISLTASPAEMPHSSLVHMIATAGRLFAGAGRTRGSDERVSTCEPAVEYFYSAERLQFEPLVSSLNEAIEAGQPVLIMTTAFALVQFLDGLEEAATTLSLPEGSRIMETGGYKGRSRSPRRDELYDCAAKLLGLPRRNIVNEYGMTEMSSQFYDRTLWEPDLEEAEARIKMAPPWVRSRVVDPATGEPVMEGEIGVLQHVDLANLDSCAFLRTSDSARGRGEGFELLGRLPNAEQRGCSLDYEALRP